MKDEHAFVRMPLRQGYENILHIRSPDSFERGAERRQGAMGEQRLQAGTRNAHAVEFGDDPRSDQAVAAAMEEVAFRTHRPAEEGLPYLGDAIDQRIVWRFAGVGRHGCAVDRWLRARLGYGCGQGPRASRGTD